MALSELAVRTAKGQEKPYKLSDAGGLYVLVQPNGNRLWRLDYRFLGKRKTLALGAYPIVGLADARERRDTAKKLLTNGIDPAEQRRAEKVAASTKAENTFGLIAKEYLDRLEHDDAAPKTIQKNKWLLENLAGDLSPRAISEISAADVLAVLKQVERSGRHESAVRLKSAISAVFRLAIATLRAQNDPTFPLRGALKAPKVTNRAAIVCPKKFGALLASIDVYDGWPTLKWALQFAALTATRPGEVRLAQWTEFDFQASRWTIPAQRTKMRREHDVALSRQSIVLLEEVREFSGNSKLVFSSIRTMDKPLSENAMNSALRRMGYMNHEHTAHGFRSSFSTILNGAGYDAEVVEMCLAHQDANSVRRVYNRAQKWPEREAMMQAWADMMDGFKRG